MSKRLFRLLPVDFATRLADLVETDLHVVERGGITRHGRLVSHDATSLQLRDALRRRQTVYLADIEEIVFDKVAAW